MNIAVIGTGYVGLVSGVCLASIGHTVVGIDIDANKVASLEAGVPDIYEQGLESLLLAALDAQQVRFSTRIQDVASADVVIIAVGTPQHQSGEADLSAVYAAAESTAEHLAPGAIVATKSTVPVGTGHAIRKILSNAGRSDVTVASNPEFLRQGHAVHDFLQPDRIVIGADDGTTLDRLEKMYDPIVHGNTPLIRTDVTTAELIKYAANTFLATKLAYVNEMADLCEIVGASIDDVTYAVGLDDRIAPSYMVAGPGFGGSCLPKDTEALLHTFSASGTRSRVLAAAIEANRDRRSALATRVVDAIGYEPSLVAVWGLTFKADTDDLRDSPAIDLIRGLTRRRIAAVVYDPLVSYLPQDVEAKLAGSPLEAAAGSDAIVIATEWPEFTEVDLEAVASAMDGTAIVDLRNVLASEAVNAAGLDHHPLGNPRSLATDYSR
jgi:UDPglucose 6-dehydrogenase